MPSDWMYALELPLDMHPFGCECGACCYPEERTMAGEQRLFILWTDECEYYFVCSTCFHEFFGMQWSGSTRSLSKDYKAQAESDRKWHEANGTECEFCGPKGNGGWSINGVFPAAIRRDERLSKEGGSNAQG